MRGSRQSRVPYGGQTIRQSEKKCRALPVRERALVYLAAVALRARQRPSFFGERNSGKQILLNRNPAYVFLQACPVEIAENGIKEG